ncbi:MAG: hypothetical protein OHK0052_23960 [Anaerolineales bacterium]
MTSEDTPTVGRLAQIMIVDDHPNTAEMLARVIRTLEMPLNVRTATSARDAITQIGNTVLDILITDFMMPGFNGLNLVEELIAKNCEPRHTIMITAYDTPGLAIAARRYKVQEYLVKPVAPEKLRDLVAGLLRNIQSESQLAQQGNRRFRILIADDYSDNVRLLSARLQHEGYEYLVARNGNEALERLRAEKPDLLLLDINMPQKDGFEVLAEMRADEQIAHIPVIVITAARINSQDVRKGISLGADDYITKPFDWHELAARIRNKLRVKRHEDELAKQNRQLHLLIQAGQAFSRSTNLAELSTALIDVVVQVTDAQNVGVLWMGSDMPSLTVFNPEKASNFTQLDVWLQFLGSDTARQLTPNQAMFLTLANADYAKLGASEGKAAIVAPIRYQYMTLGLVIATHPTENHFHIEHLQTFDVLLPQVALAAQNLLSLSAK